VLDRVIKVSKRFADSDRSVMFAVSDAEDFRHELDEYGLSYGDKPVVAARNEKDEKFVMETDFRSVFCVKSLLDLLQD